MKVKFRTKISVLLLFLVSFLEAKEIELTRVGSPVKIDFSKVAILDMDAFYGRKDSLKGGAKGKEYHLIQDMSFQTKETKDLIKKAYLITDKGTYELSLQEVKNIKRENYEDEDAPPLDYYDHVFISKTKIEFDKIAFLSFHKFKIENIVFFDKNQKPEYGLVNEKIFNASWIEVNVGRGNSRWKLSKLPNHIMRIETALEKGRGNIVKTGEYSIDYSKCKRRGLIEIYYYECENKTNFTASEDQILHVPIEGQPYPDFPLFCLDIDGVRHYFVWNEYTFYSKENNVWIGSKQITGWNVGY